MVGRNSVSCGLIFWNTTLWILVLPDLGRPIRMMSILFRILIIFI